MWRVTRLGSSVSSLVLTLRGSIDRVTMSSLATNAVSYVGPKDALDIDNMLFNDYKYSVDQLMEIAGLCCAQTLATCYSISSSERGKDSKQTRVLIVCGPGNNGGDGLAAARHLLAFCTGSDCVIHFHIVNHYLGYRPEIFYPKRPSKPIYEILTAQCMTLRIPFLEDLPIPADIDGKYSVMLDAIFGFSFKGNVRSPFDRTLDILKQCKTPICSVDVPSGWDVEKGNVGGIGLEPEVLISLTCPKICAKEFRGRHFLGLRIVPEEVAKKFNIVLPDYPGIEQIVEL